MVLIHQAHMTEEDRAKLHDLLKVGSILQDALLMDIFFYSPAKAKAKRRSLRPWVLVAQPCNAFANALAKKGWIMPSPNCLAQALSLDLMASKKHIGWHEPAVTRQKGGPIGPCNC